MTYQSRPNVDGVYRIKVLDQSLYVQAVFGAKPELKLSPLSDSEKKQQWYIAAVIGKPNVYNIINLDDKSSLSFKKTKETYWGYGFPMPLKNSNTEWFFKEQTASGKTFCKIGYSDGKNTDVFDSNSSDLNTINFYYNKRQIAGAEKQCYVLEFLPNVQLTPSALDLLIIQDATGSQQPYIDKARDEIVKITNSLAASQKFPKGALRAGVIAFRDHSPQEPDFLTRSLPLTSDIPSVQTYLRGLVADGGGDGPEAQCEALFGAVTADWRADATKVAVLITDAPPHGAGEAGDTMPDGCPDQNDPIVLARRMGQLGITLIVVACQPTMGQYKQALYLYSSLVQFSGGRIIPLGDADGLSKLIDNAVQETVAIEAQVLTRSAAILRMTGSFAVVSKEVQDSLSSSGVRINTIAVNKVFEDTDESRENMKIFSEAATMKEARARITKSAGPKIIPPGTQSLALESKPIVLEQTERIVMRCQARASV